MATGMKYPVHTEEDSHLRSVWQIADYAVWVADGEIGRLKGFIVDEASWHIGYLTVKAGDWLHRHSGANSHSLGRVHFLGRSPGEFTQKLGGDLRSIYMTCIGNKLKTNLSTAPEVTALVNGLFYLIEMLKNQTS